MVDRARSLAAVRNESVSVLSSRFSCHTPPVGQDSNAPCPNPRKAIATRLRFHPCGPKSMPLSLLAPPGHPPPQTPARGLFLLAPKAVGTLWPPGSSPSARPSIETNDHP